MSAPLSYPQLSIPPISSSMVCDASLTTGSLGCCGLAGSGKTEESSSGAPGLRRSTRSTQHMKEVLGGKNHDLIRLVQYTKYTIFFHCRKCGGYYLILIRLASYVYGMREKNKINKYIKKLKIKKKLPQNDTITEYSPISKFQVESSPPPCHSPFPSSPLPVTVPSTACGQCVL